ncbi:MAG: 2,5-diamino-6-(ribosylamino)-4(3H)-pyrimidinone 5'-phosphate reductase [Candidatus Thorarchaeota archaeon]
MKDYSKPYIILSAAMTIDGKIASINGDTELSDEADWKEVHKLRSQVDAIMVGKATILKDNPKLHIKYYEHEGYYRIIADSNLLTPLDSNVVTFKPELYPTIICATEKASKDRIEQFQAKNVKIIQVGNHQVNLKKLLFILFNLGIKTILLEGGGNLNWSFIKEDLVDEMRLTIAPWIIGGKNAISLVEGLGFGKINQAPKYHLLDVKKRDNYVILRYKRNVN